MTRTATATLLAALCLGAGFALPAAAAAQASGGTSAPDGATLRTEAAPGGLKVGPRALYGRWQRASGVLDGLAAGRAVELQLGDGRTGWRTVGRAIARTGGAFVARWRPDRVGRLTLRAVAGRGSTGAARTAATPAVARTVVYRPAIATHFGPGFYGSRTACGQILTPRTIGVAHVTLPCGTMVEFLYGGRTLRAPVVDRGPYANNATWDLTVAASRALRFSGKGWVGSMIVARAARRTP